MSRRRAFPRSDDRRSPLERLEGLIGEPAPARSRRMLSRIRRELDDSAAPGPWIAAAHALAAKGTISEDGLRYFLEIFLECVTLRSTVSDPEMLRLSEEMRRVERAHGLGEDDYWLLDEAPAEWRALNDAWDRRDDEIRVATLRALGHDELAAELERDPEEFSRRGSSGHVELWGLEDEEE